MKNELLTFLWYKDYKKEVEELIKHGEYFYNKLKYVPSPLIKNEYNDFIHFLWTYFVINYGDYGTSPYYGWINNWKGVKEILETAYNHYMEE